MSSQLHDALALCIPSGEFCDEFLEFCQEIRIDQDIRETNAARPQGTQTEAAHMEKSLTTSLRSVLVEIFSFSLNMRYEWLRI